MNNEVHRGILDIMGWYPGKVSPLPPMDISHLYWCWLPATDSVSEETLFLSLCVCAHSVVSDSFATPWTVVCQASLSLEFSRQEYWSRLPFPSPGECSCLYICVCEIFWTPSHLPLLEEEIEKMLGITECAKSGKLSSHDIFNCLDLGWWTPQLWQRKRICGPRFVPKNWGEIESAIKWDL